MIIFADCFDIFFSPFSRAAPFIDAAAAIIISMMISIRVADIRAQPFRAAAPFIFDTRRFSHYAIRYTLTPPCYYTRHDIFHYIIDAARARCHLSITTLSLFADYVIIHYSALLMLR